MPSQLSAALEPQEELADAIRRADRILMPMLQEHSQAAKAIWDVRCDQAGREVLTLALTDPWGYASEDFAPDELADEDQLRHRFYKLIGELVMPGRSEEPRERIEVRDAFATAEQLDQLRHRLGRIPQIEQARVRLHNQVRFLPQRPEYYLVTDFAVEVNRSYAEHVRDAIRDVGFPLRDDPWLIHREGVRDALHRLVEQHRRDRQPAPDFAICFRLQDREAIHLLEVSAQAPELEDDDLEAVGFWARGVIPHARTLKIYLTHPEDLRRAFQTNRDHPFFHDLRNNNCDFLFPEDHGNAFRREFSELLEA